MFTFCNMTHVWYSLYVMNTIDNAFIEVRIFFVFEYYDKYLIITLVPVYLWK